MAFTLPPLPYPADALEAAIDKTTMEIHHGKHHKAYVDNLNAALEGQPALQSKSIDQLMRDISSVPESIRQKVINNGGGHANHSMFWEIMAPNAGGDPTGPLAEAIKSTFTDFASLQGEDQGSRPRPLRQRLVLARLQRRQAGDHQHGQPGQPADAGGRDAVARRGRVGTRLLSALPEQARRLPRRLVEGRQLAGSGEALRRRPRHERIHHEGTKSTEEDRGEAHNCLCLPFVFFVPLW